MGTTTSAAASPLTFQNTWSISYETERIEVTAFGDTNKTYVTGIADAAGEFAGFYDDATAQTLLALLGAGGVATFAAKINRVTK